MGGNTYYVFADNLGSPRSLVQASTNAEVWRWDSDPFGNAVPSGQVTYNMRFPGQIADIETSLFQNGFRDYDPLAGRYIQSDPIGLNGGLSRYAYVGGNPLSYIDPYGLATFQVGGPVNINLFGWVYQYSGGLAIDGHGNFGSYLAPGPGVGVGDRVSIGTTFYIHQTRTTLTH